MPCVLQVRRQSELPYILYHIIPCINSDSLHTFPCLRHVRPSAPWCARASTCSSPRHTTACLLALERQTSCFALTPPCRPILYILDCWYMIYASWLSPTPFEMPLGQSCFGTYRVLIIPRSIYTQRRLHLTLTQPFSLPLQRPVGGVCGVFVSIVVWRE